MRLLPSNDTLTVHAPAKLNLFLEVLGKRPDGFHELETLMTTVDLYDTLSFTEDFSREIRLRCFDVGIHRDSSVAGVDPLPTGRGNLIVQAANLLREKTGVRRGVEVVLQKRIPSAAGLAGGSSDAAATLVALNRLWQLGLGRNELIELAAELGSDVPFFLAPTSSAICRGRGELIEPLDLPQCLHIVIAKPRSGLSTPLVFRHCQPADVPRRVGPLVDALRCGERNRAARFLFNSLQAPAERLNSEVEHLKFVFSKQPVLGHIMSGSGSSWFGICESRSQARRIAARLASQRIGSVYVAQSRP